MAADAILVNLGTVTERQVEAMRRAVVVANERSIPWVLDPVGVQHLSFRRELALGLIGQKPTIIRGNSDEIRGLTGSVPNLERQTVLLETGVIDRVVDNFGVVEVTGGVPMLQAVTATGCAQGGLCAAFLGRGQAPREAALSASKLMKRAGEMARERAKAPGGFQVALIDALWELSHD